MDKQSFIEQLRRSLSSISDYTFVNDTIAYYENYIDCQIRAGKTEEEVMRELGDPRLIAKSIIASCSEGEETQTTKSRYFDEEEQNQKKRGFGSRNTRFFFNGHTMNMPGWLIKLLVIVIIALVLFLLFTVFSFVFSIVAPLIIPAFIAYYVYCIFIKKRW